MTDLTDIATIHCSSGPDVRKVQIQQHSFHSILSPSWSYHYPGQRITLQFSSDAGCPIFFWCWMKFPTLRAGEFHFEVSHTQGRWILFWSYPTRTEKNQFLSHYTICPGLNHLLLGPNILAKDTSTELPRHHSFVSRKHRFKNVGFWFWTGPHQQKLEWSTSAKVGMVHIRKIWNGPHQEILYWPWF